MLIRVSGWGSVRWLSQSSETALSLSSLTAVGSIDGRYERSTAALRPYFSEFALIRFRVLVEVEWLRALSETPDIKEIPKLSAGDLEALGSIAERFSEADARRVKEIERTTNHDVKAVEYFIKERMDAGPAALRSVREFVHFACTSEDINNLAYAAATRAARAAVILPAMDSVVGDIRAMAHANAEVPMLARTHGQPATPTTVGKELANFVHRLGLHREALATAPIRGKFNGAVGNFNAHIVAYPHIDWPSLSRHLIEGRLGLVYNPYTTQIEPHDWLAELFHAACRFNTVLLDFDRDMWGYISLGYLRQKAVAGEVGSSTMPHKVNPIAFENSEGNLGLANAVMRHLADKLLVSRFQRDLSDSTVMRAIGVGFAHSLVAYSQTRVGLARVDVDRDRLYEDLDANWEVLAEPIQTVMRRYGVSQPYEKLKELTRGRRVTREGMLDFIATLAKEGVPHDELRRLEMLTPWEYTGNAAALARKA